jgi:hypothetical protein
MHDVTPIIGQACLPDSLFGDAKDSLTKLANAVKAA